MNTRLLKRVRIMFDNDLAPRETNRYNQREWCRAVRLLGGKWLLAESLGRLA